MEHCEPGDASRRRDLPVYLGLRFLTEAAALALSVAIGWTVYDVSKSPLSLGIVGIVQFIPIVLLTLPAGELCDRLSPRPLVVASLALQCACALAFLAMTRFPSTGLAARYGVLLMLGVARALAGPAEQALLPLLVQPAQLPRAVALGSTAWQSAAILGPALGGLAFAAGAATAYLASAVAFLVAMLGAMTLRGRPLPAPEGAWGAWGDGVQRVLEGLRFVRGQPVILGAMSLDLLAVLVGGATALLPVYAQDILKVGPFGLGMLRSAPAAGACVVGLVLARHPPERGAGPKLFAAVMVFGAATAIFALSRSFVVSLAALAAAGASDMVSVNIRASLIQLATPDAMRGRVSAVAALFIGTSSELGAFETGLTAALLGSVPAVALGGIGTIVAAALWMAVFPGIMKVDRLHPDPG
ncbi:MULTISPECIES: MFS transporter [Burkholderia]|uniref:Major facilitator superfamily transporter n=1 Tax=Burkholderia paludis TaxID=1506587 RepID=A0A6J5DPV0_9BURK|nr:MULTISPECIES: MFS transporter [Burkholderia]CAB3754876.1 Enterobactin exporter EntS [Burkholderia paludis]VWB33203.1 major facilitator superfamily transporter [Burkholderia paludis]